MTAASIMGKIRRRSGLGLRALARRAQTSHATLLAYERGVKEPRFETLERVAAAAGFTLEIDLRPRAEPADQAHRKAQELLDALELAGQFPARHRRQLAAPIFGRSG